MVFGCIANRLEVFASKRFRVPGKIDPFTNCVLFRKLPSFLEGNPSQVRVSGMTLAANQFQRNDWVIYRKHKSSVSPGPRASDVHAAGKGNTYRYVVEKYWVVEEVLDDSQLKICTRRGKRHLVNAGDRSLRKARWWERLLYRGRFEAIDLNSPVSLEDEIGSATN